jgi:hypothetical protein
MFKFTQTLSRGFEIFFSGLLEIGDSIYQEMDYRNKFYLILTKTNWPPPYDLFLISNSNIVNNFVNRFEKYGMNSIQKDIDHLMVTWHSHEIIDKIFSEWKYKSWLKSRLPILKDAIWAHQNRLFSLSIPTLIPQIEGVIADNLKIIGRLKQKDYKKQFRSLLNEALIIKNRNENLSHIFIEVLLAEFERGTKEVGPISRHAILHGNDTSYATEVNSLKVILLLNAINKLFRFVALINSKKYHLNGCSLIRNSDRKKVFFASVTEAKRNGYINCKKCLKNEAIYLVI